MAFDPDVYLRKGELEARGKNADHNVRCARQTYYLTDRVGIAMKAPLPQAADHNDGRAAGRVFFG
jgi:hypothetical protein